MAPGNPDKRYLELAEKWLNGTITPEEEKEFAAWYNAGQDETVFLPPVFAPGREALRERILRNIEQRRETKVIRRPRYWRMAAAAAVILLIVAGIWLWYNGRTTRTSQPLAVKSNSMKDRAPGGYKARLTLANGAIILLDSSRNGNLTREGNTDIKKQGGQLIYDTLASASQADRALAFNTLTTPRGGQYQLVLPDGSKVWLNAVSSLRYPTAFTGNERRVQLTGEAYFEIKSIPRSGGGKIPFIVEVNTSSGAGTRGMEVEVLGTGFNVTAYNDETMIRTTLLEGSVKIRKGDNTGLLRPGQQAGVTAHGDIKIFDDADLEATVAWKNGYFKFDDANIAEIMRQAARWYDMDVGYDKSIMDESFSGTLPRSEYLSSLLKILELTKTVKFTIEGRKVMVEPYR